MRAQPAWFPSIVFFDEIFVAASLYSDHEELEL